MKKIAILLGLCMIVPLAASRAATQPQLREWSANERGRGVLQLENRRDEIIDNASIELRRNGDAEVRVAGQTTTTWTLIGRWRFSRVNEVDLEFNSGGTDARGTARLRQGGGLEHLEITGRSRGQRFSLNFDGGRRDDGGGFPGGGQGANDFVGYFRASEPMRSGREDSTLIRMLKIHEDGTVDLVSRYRGAPPIVGRETERRFGRLVRDVSTRKKISHSGTWRASSRQRVGITLVRLDSTRLETQLTLEFRDRERNQLVTTDWDRTLYGELPIQFTRAKDDNDDDTDYSNQTPDRLAGTYSTRLRVPDTNGDIERRLLLSANGIATLTTQWMDNGRIEISSRAERELGRTLRFLQNQRYLEQSGKWEYRNNQIVVELESRYNTRGRNVLTFDFRGNTLQAVTFDQDLYGDRSFSLIRTR